jgi:hypothetical protein
LARVFVAVSAASRASMSVEKTASAGVGLGNVTFPFVKATRIALARAINIITAPGSLSVATT